jgi:hypothetical protein
MTVRYFHDNLFGKNISTIEVMVSFPYKQINKSVMWITGYYLKRNPTGFTLLVVLR